MKRTTSYKDRNGKRIRNGAVVAKAITCNHDAFRGFTFTVAIVKKRGTRLILDGVHAFCYLQDINPREVVVLDSETDLRAVEATFIREFRPHSTVPATGQPLT